MHAAVPLKNLRSRTTKGMVLRDMNYFLKYTCIFTTTLKPRSGLLLFPPPHYTAASPYTSVRVQPICVFTPPPLPPKNVRSVLLVPLRPRSKQLGHGSHLHHPARVRWLPPVDCIPLSAPLHPWRSHRRRTSPVPRTRLSGPIAPNVRRSTGDMLLVRGRPLSHGD